MELILLKLCPVNDPLECFWWIVLSVFAVPWHLHFLAKSAKNFSKLEDRILCKLFELMPYQFLLQCMLNSERNSLRSEAVWPKRYPVVNWKPRFCWNHLLTVFEFLNCALSSWDSALRWRPSEFKGRTGHSLIICSQIRWARSWPFPTQKRTTTAVHWHRLTSRLKHSEQR